MWRQPQRPECPSCHLAANARVNVRQGHEIGYGRGCDRIDRESAPAQLKFYSLGVPLHSPGIADCGRTGLKAATTSGMNPADETGLTSIVATAYHCNSPETLKLRWSAGGKRQNSR